MTTPQLIADPVWPWPVTIAASLLVIGLVLLTYPPRVRHFPPFWRRLLLGLRLSAALVLIWMLLRPAVQFVTIDSQSAQLVILTDVSRSMTTPDGPGAITRRAAVLKTLADVQPQLAKLAEQLELRFIEFDDSLHPVDQPTADAPGNMTSIGKALDNLRREDSGKRIIGAVLMSDGAQRATGDADVDPRAAARRIAEQRGIHVHTVVYGSAELSTAGVDLAIEDVLVAPDTFERKSTPVQLQLVVRGAPGRKLRIRLLLEDRTGKQTGESGKLVELPMTSEARTVAEVETSAASAVIPVALSFVAERAGEYKLAVEAVPLDGELKVNNNRVETLVTVRKGGLRVAYFDIVRPEAKFLWRLNQTSQIQLDWVQVRSGERRTDTRINPDLFTPGRYDAYIIGDVPASVFFQGGVDLLPKLADRVREGAGLAMIGGLSNFESGGYGTSAKMRELLPVALQGLPELPPGNVDPARHFDRSLQMLPAGAGLRHYLMQIAPRDNERAWAALPPLGGATKLEEKSNTIMVLAQTPDSIPLMFGTDNGRSRVLAFAGDDTFRWYIHGFREVHQRFWQQVILWLTHKEFDTDAPVWLRIDPRNFAPGATAPLLFGARDGQKQPIPDADFKVEVLRPDGERKNVTVVHGGPEALAEFTDTQKPGDYWVTVSATHKGANVGLPAMGRFIVDERDLELDNPAADPDLMAEIADITGASTVPAEQLGSFLEEMLKAGIASEITRQSQINLWDNWPALVFFVLLMTTEWVLRKRRGLV